MILTKNNSSLYRQHLFQVVLAVFTAEHIAITDEDRQALKNHELSTDDYIYKVVDELLNKFYGKEIPDNIE